MNGFSSPPPPPLPPSLPSSLFWVRSQERLKKGLKAIALVQLSMMVQKILAGSSLIESHPNCLGQWNKVVCRMDAPYAPKALSYTFVSGVVEEVADLNDLESQLKDVEDVYSRREYGQAVLKNLQVSFHYFCNVKAAPLLKCTSMSPGGNKHLSSSQDSLSSYGCSKFPPCLGTIL